CELGADARRDIRGSGRGIREEVVFTNVELDQRALAESSDPSLVARVQVREVLGVRIALAWTAARRDALEDHVERAVQVQHEPRRPRRGSEEQLGVQLLVQLPV